MINQDDVLKAFKPKPIKIDLSRIHELQDILEFSLKPNLERAKKNAMDFERNVFEYATLHKARKVYITEIYEEFRNESLCIENLLRIDLIFKFHTRKPKGVKCTMHDFTNLCIMSAKEFDALALRSENYKIVRKYRAVMRKRKDILKLIHKHKGEKKHGT